MKSLEQTLSEKHLPALDGIRACAVGTVMVYHFGYNLVPGDLGVTAFFVLSGFLITWLLLKEWRRNGEVSLRNFYLRRGLRIFPAYYAFLAFAFVQDYVRGYPWSLGLLESGVLFVVNYYNAFNGHPTTTIAHAWSLGVEQQFYLGWPLIFVFLARKGTTAFSLALVGIVCLVAAWRSSLVLLLGADHSYVYNAFETRFDNLAIGCLLAVGMESPQWRACAGTLSRWAVLPFATLALLLCSRIGGGVAYHYSIGMTVDSLLLAVFVLQMLCLYETRTWSWLELPFVRYLGHISYPLYLYHLFGLGIGHRASMLPPTGQFIVGCLVSIVIASVSYWLIERPCLSWKRRLEVAIRPGTMPETAVS